MTSRRAAPPEQGAVPAAPPERSRRERRLTLLGLTLAAIVLYGAALGARDLWNPNEPIYGEVVVEMSARGDWVLPTANGRVFAEKPILYYWLALVSAKALGGIDELSLRLPTALAGVFGVVLLYALVARYLSRRQSLVVAACLGTQYGYWFAARQIQMDTLLTVLVLATLVAVLGWLDHGTSASRAWLAAGVAAGTGLIAKGPLAVLLPGMVLVGYLVVTRRRPPPRFWRPALLSLLPLLLIAAPWFVLLWRRDPDALAEMTLRQNVSRFVNAWDHDQPWWYYLKYVWLELAPWSWIAPLALGLAPHSRDEGRLLRLAGAWLILVVLFFSLSESKRAPYLLPTAPAVAILAGIVLERWHRGSLEPLRRRVVWGFVILLSVVCLLAGAVLVVEGPRRIPDAGTALVLTGLAIAAGCVAIWLVLLRRRRPGPRAGPRLRPNAAAPIALLYGLLLVVSVVVFPRVNDFRSARRFGLQIQQQTAAGEVAGFGLPPQRGEYSFYSRSPIPILSTEDELVSFWGRPGPRFLVVEGDHFDHVRRLLPRSEVVAEDSIGSRHAYLLALPN